MNQVQYGSYNFPNPQPFVALGHEPVYVAGVVDHFAETVTLVGTITGNNLASLAVSKRSMERGLASEYEALSVGGESFPVAKAQSISFDESNLLTVLPYSVEFLAYKSGDFSQYFGVSDPKNTWSYTEQQDRIVKVSHNVSAAGVKVDSNSPLTNAKNFVESQLTGFYNHSNFFTGNSAVFLTRKEEIDKAKNSYSVSDEYDLSVSRDSVYSSPTGVIVTANSKIVYSNENGLQVSVDGSIIGGLTGYGAVTVNTGMFSPDNAKALVLDAVIKSKSDFEKSVYGFVERGPTAQEYTTNEEANKIDFSFSFLDPEKFTKFDNQYSVSVNATKDAGVIGVSVNGSVKYSAVDIPFVGGPIEDSERFEEIQAFFNSLNIYGYALWGYSAFCAEFPDYNDGLLLTPSPKTTEVTKDPFEPSISYNFQYSNEPSGNLTVSISDQLPIIVDSVQESIEGFAVQENINEKLGVLGIEASKKGTPADMSSLVSYTDQFFPQKRCFYSEKSSGISDNSISYSFQSFYRE